MTVARSLIVAGSLCLATSVASAGPGIIINEYQYDPANSLAGDANKDTVVNTTEDEFIEFVNTSAVAVDMSAWTIIDATNLVRHSFPGGTVVSAGCAIVVFGGGHPPINLFGGAVVQVASSGLLGLNNDGDTITLRDAGNVPVASVTYPDPGATVDQSFTRDPDITGSVFVEHSTATGSGGTLFSPGVRINGTAFGPCVPPGPDMDGDGHPDDVDNCPMHANPNQADCDQDGQGDLCQILKNPGLDCNMNGELDPCEPDCNNTGFPDDCDIILGISMDCNGNLVPDECELGPNDCNGNSIPDDCDITSGVLHDVNMNGIPDECESTLNVVINEVMAAPTSDTNGDLISNATQDEFIEIVNASGGSVNIGGWTLSDGGGVRHVFPANTIVPDQCGVVVWGGGTPIGQFGGMQKQVASTGTLSLNNTGDAVRLRDTANLIVDVGDYDSPTEGVSDTRSPDITGEFTLHTMAQPGVNFSPGRKIDLSQFGGCPPVLPDGDNDGIPDVNDNCPEDPNPFQEDCDMDGLGDACETDPDLNMNGIPDNCEVGVPGNVKLSEIRIDQPGTDNDEYFEIKGPAMLSLNGLTLIVLGDGTGGSGVIESVTSLSGMQIPADGYFLAVETSFTLAPPAQRDLVITPNGLNFENDDNVTFILVTNFSGLLAQDLDTNDDGTLDVTPWGGVVDAVSLIEEPNPPTATEYAYAVSLGGVNVGPVPGPFPLVPGQVYRCETVGTWTIGTFDPIGSPPTDTAGVANLACTGSPCPGDRDGNGVVNIDDLLLVITTWGTNDPVGDANMDGIVNIDDLLIVITGWGPCPVDRK